MARQKVYLDSDYNKVGKGAENAAFIFNVGDERIEKLRTARRQNAVGQDRVTDDEGPVQRRSEPAANAADEDTTTERVGRGRSGTR